MVVVDQGAAMPIYNKNLWKSSSPEPMPWGWIFAQIIEDERSSSCKIDGTHWRLTFLRQGQVCFPMHLYEPHKNVENFKRLLLWSRRANVAQISCGALWPKWPPCPYMIKKKKQKKKKTKKKTFKIFFCEPSRPLGLIISKIIGTGGLLKLLKWWFYVDVWPSYGMHLYGPNTFKQENCWEFIFGHLL